MDPDDSLNDDQRDEPSTKIIEGGYKKKRTCKHGRDAHIKGRNSCLWCTDCRTGLLTCGHITTLISGVCQNGPKAPGDYICEMKFVLDFLKYWDKRVASIPDMAANLRSFDPERREEWTEKLKLTIDIEQQKHASYYRDILKDCLTCMKSKRRSILAKRAVDDDDAGAAHSGSNIDPPKQTELGNSNAQSRRSEKSEHVGDIPASSHAHALHTPRGSFQNQPSFPSSTTSPRHRSSYRDFPPYPLTVNSLAVDMKPATPSTNPSKRKRSQTGSMHAAPSKRHAAYATSRSAQSRRTSRLVDVEPSTDESDDSLIDRSRGSLQTIFANASTNVLVAVFAEFVKKDSDLAREILGSKFMAKKSITQSWFALRIQELERAHSPMAPVGDRNDKEGKEWQDDEDSHDFVDEGYEDSSDESDIESVSGLLARFNSHGTQKQDHFKNTAPRDDVSAQPEEPCAEYHRRYDERPLSELGECRFHPGVLIYQNSFGNGPERWWHTGNADLKMIDIHPQMYLWTCCQGPGNASPCQTGTHVGNAKTSLGHTAPQNLGDVSNHGKARDAEAAMGNTRPIQIYRSLYGQGVADSDMQTIVHDNASAIASANDNRADDSMFEDVPDVTPPSYLLSGNLKVSTRSVGLSAILQLPHASLLVPKELEIALRNCITPARYLYYKRKIFWECARQVAERGEIKRKALTVAASRGIAMTKFSDILKAFSDAGMIELSFFNEHIMNRYRAITGKDVAENAPSKESLSIKDYDMSIRGRAANTSPSFEAAEDVSARVTRGATSGILPTQHRQEDDSHRIAQESLAKASAEDVTNANTPNSNGTLDVNASASPQGVTGDDSGLIGLAELSKRIQARAEAPAATPRVEHLKVGAAGVSPPVSSGRHGQARREVAPGAEGYPEYARYSETRCRRARATIDKPDRVFTRDGCAMCVRKGYTCYVNEASGKCAYCISKNYSRKNCAENWANYPYPEQLKQILEK